MNNEKKNMKTKIIKQKQSKYEIVFLIESSIDEEKVFTVSNWIVKQQMETFNYTFTSPVKARHYFEKQCMYKNEMKGR